MIHLDTLGIVNGCIDSEAQQQGYIDILNNNTYGLKLASESAVQAEYDNLPECYDLLHKCFAAADIGDSLDTGDNQTVNEICNRAGRNCLAGSDYPYADLDFYDIAQPSTTPFPANYFIGFLNQPWVQQALGLPINFTESIASVSEAFNSGDDFDREDLFGGYLGNLGLLLDQGVKVALMYGDRDFACNVSLPPVCERPS